MAIGVVVVGPYRIQQSLGSRNTVAKIGKIKSRPIKKKRSSRHCRGRAVKKIEFNVEDITIMSLSTLVSI